MIAPILCSVLALAAPQQDALHAAAPATARELVAARLTVNGHAIPTAEIERELCSSIGRPLVDAYVLEFMADEELVWRASDAIATEARSTGKTLSPAEIRAESQRRKNDAHAQLWPSDEDVDARLAKILAYHHKQFPDVPEEATIRARFHTREWARDILRRELYFEAVFLPTDAQSWSATTIAALDTAGGDGTAESARSEIRRRTVDAATFGASALASDVPERDKLRRLVGDALTRLLRIETSADGLPLDVIARADADGDGQPEFEIARATLWPRVESALHEVDVEFTRRWLAAARATRARLETDGSPMDANACASAFARHAQELLDTTHRAVDQVALDAGFRSLAAYREAFCLQHAFRALVERQRAASSTNGSPKLSDASTHAAALVELMRPRAVESAGRGMVNAEAILIPLYERPEFRWKRGGWKGAREEADALQFEFDDNRKRYGGTLQLGQTSEAVNPDALWLERLDEVSGFWDAPPALATVDCFGHPRNKGRFGRAYRDDLEHMLGESIQTQIAFGTSIADHVFSEQKEDTIEGPVRGPQGYYFTRLLARLATKNPLDLRIEANKKQVEDEAARMAFLQYAKEALASAKIEGL